MNPQPYPQEVCHQYWPQDGYQEYKVMGVELVDELKKDGYIVRSLNVTKRVCESQLLRLYVWLPPAVPCRVRILIV